MPKLFELAVEMFVLPGLERSAHSVLKPLEGCQGSAALIELPADCGLSEIKMSVAARVIAFAVELHVLFRAKRFAVQAMSGAKLCAQPKEELAAAPIFRKKIAALMQANAQNGKQFAGALMHVARDGFGRNRMLHQARHLQVKVLVVKLASKRTKTLADAVELNRFEKGQAGTVIMPMAKW